MFSVRPELIVSVLLAARVRLLTVMSLALMIGLFATFGMLVSLIETGAGPGLQLPALFQLVSPLPVQVSRLVTVTAGELANAVNVQPDFSVVLNVLEPAVLVAVAR